MDSVNLFILLCLVILISTIVYESYKSDINTVQSEGKMDQQSDQSDQIDSRLTCKYKLNWQNDPNMFTNPEITINPFAKSNNEHCRTNSQCKSGKCNVFYCDDT